MQTKQIKNLVLAALMSALVLVATSFIKLPVPVTNGYIHLGDGFILLGVAVLGPWGVAAAALGSALADLMGGYVMYILPTALIKGAMALVALPFMKKSNNWLMAAAGCVLAELVMVAGYCLAETFMYGWAAAISAVGPNLVQAAGGVAVAMVLMPVFNRLRKQF